MKRFWFEFIFDKEKIPSGMGMGCGVTALDYGDAIKLISSKVFEGRALPKIKKVIEDIDVSTLDPNHVLLNMSPPNLRGIWFPMGYV